MRLKLCFGGPDLPVMFHRGIHITILLTVLLHHLANLIAYNGTFKSGDPLEREDNNDNYTIG